MAGSSTNGVAATGTNVTQLGNVTVIGQLNAARNNILPDLGATAYTHTADHIAMQSQGENAPFNQVILRSPGVAEDSAVNGDLHVRGEHANLQYRIDDVLLPEGITGFGLELDPRFIEGMQLIDGSLPAEYGFRTAGVVDIQTKNGGKRRLGGPVWREFRHLPAKFRIWRHLRANGSTFWTAATTTTIWALRIRRAAHDAIHDTTDQFKDVRLPVLYH